MTINNNSVEQINVALLDMDKKIKSTASKSASASDFKNLEASVDNIKRTLDETKTGLEPGKTYNINISGNAATADKAKEAEKANKLVNALTVNGETYDGSEAVDAGVQKIENGGTGVTTQADINKAFVGNLEAGDSDVTDGTEFVSSHASDNGFDAPTALNKPYRRQFVNVWNYIKGKISSVLGLTSEKVSSYDSHLTNKDNPHSVTKSQVGLGSVVNTGDSATPVSGGTTKFTTGGAYTELNKKVDKVDGKGLSSNDFTNTYKDKLDSIDTTVTTNSSNLVTSGAVSTAISTEVTNRNTAITNAINNLDVSSVGGDGKYISAISETNGKISATSTTMDTAPTANSVKAVTSGGIKTAISTAETNAKNLANATGTLAIAHGGTGQTTANAAANAFINSLTVGNDVPVDNDYYVAQYVNGGTTTTTYHRRPVSKLWEYIKGKISSVLGLTATNYDGKASTAGTADYAKNMYGQILDLSALDKTKFYPVVCAALPDFAEVALYSIGGPGDAEYNQNRIHFDISTRGWHDEPFTLNIREYACFDNKEITIGCIGRGLNEGGWAIWLRGGLTYRCYTRDCNLSLKTSDYAYGGEIYTVGTNYYGGANSNVKSVFTPQSTITNGAYSSRDITAPSIKAATGFIGNLTGNVTGNVTGSSGSCTGLSAKSSFLDEYPGAGSARLTSGNIVPKDASEYGGMRKDVVTSSMTDSGRPRKNGHLLTMFWDNTGRWDSQFFISADQDLPVAKVRSKKDSSDYGDWVDIITSNNIGSQTVASAGNADKATTAGTADYAKRLKTFAYWNNPFVYDATNGTRLYVFKITMSSYFNSILIQIYDDINYAASRKYILGLWHQNDYGYNVSVTDLGGTKSNGLRVWLGNDGNVYLQADVKWTSRISFSYLEDIMGITIEKIGTSKVGSNKDINGNVLFTPLTDPIIDCGAIRGLSDLSSASKVAQYLNADLFKGNVTGNKLTIQGVTVSSNSYTDTNPKLEFKNNDSSQNISLTFTDFDAVQAPASLTLNGNQGNEYFIAPNIKATTKFIGNLKGNVTGNVTGSSGSCTGNSATADKVNHALTINGQSFDGSSALNISIQEGAYDHTVYDDASLLEWANCTDGHMKKVLVKSGTYNMTKGVNLTNAGTGYVLAEQGAMINSHVPVAFTASYEAAVIYNLYVYCDGASSSENSCAFSSVNSLTLYNCGASYTNGTAIVNRSLFEKCICYNCGYNFLNLSDSSSISIKVFYQCKCYNCECLYTILTKSDLAISFNSDSYFYKECHCVSCDAKLTTKRNIKAATPFFACYYNCYDRCVGCLSTINVNSKALTVYSTLYGFFRCQYMSSCKETHTEGYANIKGIVQCIYISSTSGINGESNTHVGNSCSIY